MVTFFCSSTIDDFKTRSISRFTPDGGVCGAYSIRPYSRCNLKTRSISGLSAIDGPKTRSILGLFVMDDLKTRSIFGLSAMDDP